MTTLELLQCRDIMREVISEDEGSTTSCNMPIYGSQVSSSSTCSTDTDTLSTDDNLSLSPTTEKLLADPLLEDVDIVTDWVNELLGLQVETERLPEALQDGVILCQLTNVLSFSARITGYSVPSGIQRYHKRCAAESIQARDNVSSFSIWCAMYDIPPVLILNPDDVVMGRNTSSLISLLLFLVRKSSPYTLPLHSRTSSSASFGTISDRVNRRSFSRGKSFDCFSDVMMQRGNKTSSLLRSRSQSVDSEGSNCSSSSFRTQPGAGTHFLAYDHDTTEAMALIKDLNLACRNINKKVVVSNFEIPGYEHKELSIEKSLEDESQACLRRRSRLFNKSNTDPNLLDRDGTTTTTNSKRRFVLKSRKPERDLDISGETLSLEDVEYLLLSAADTMLTKIKAVYKLLALRVLQSNRSKLTHTTPLELSSDITNLVYPSFTFTAHSPLSREQAFKTLRDCLVTRLSANESVRFAEVYEIWNSPYPASSTQPPR